MHTQRIQTVLGTLVLLLTLGGAMKADEIALGALNDRIKRNESALKLIMDDPRTVTELAKVLRSGEGSWRDESAWTRSQSAIFLGYSLISLDRHSEAREMFGLADQLIEDALRSGDQLMNESQMAQAFATRAKLRAVFLRDEEGAIEDLWAAEDLDPENPALTDWLRRKVEQSGKRGG